MQEQRRPRTLTTERIEAFSDGVFAIALTLLILNIRVPLGPDGRLLDERALVHALAAQWVAYLSYLLSVIIIGIFWVAHHGLFHFIRRANRPLLWLNILFLACVAFLPFPAALLGQYGGYRSSVVLYGLSLVVTGIVLDAMRWYAYRHRLFGPEADEHLNRIARRRNMLGPAVYLTAVIIALLPVRIGVMDGPALALIVYILVPFLYMLPGRVDRYWNADDDRDAAEQSASRPHSGLPQ